MFPTRINISTTRRCNLNCIHCFVNQDRVPVEDGWEMSMELFEDCMAQAMPLFQHIGLSNLGEFLSDTQFIERARIFKAYMNKKPDVWFDQVTNATLLDEEHLAPLAGLKNPVLYVLSIDAVDPLISYAIRPPGLSTQAMKNIRNINQVHARLGMQKPTIVVSVTLLKRNLLDCFNIIDFCRELGCSVYFRHAMGQGLEVNNRESLFRVPVFSNKILRKCKAYGDSQGVKVSFEPLFAQTSEEIDLYHRERNDRSIPCRIFTERYISKVDVNGDYSCCYNLARVHGNIKNIPLAKLMDHNDNVITSFMGRPIAPCTLCRGRQMQLSYIHEPAVFDLNIPDNERCYYPDINLEEHGFFDWLTTLDQKKIEQQLRKHWNMLFGETSHSKRSPSPSPYASLPPDLLQNESRDNLLKQAIDNRTIGNYTQSLKIFERLVQAFPGDTEIKSALDDICRELGLCVQEQSQSESNLDKKEEMP
ncbi:radical SAM protein [Trichlorobacter ammonificans]|uniref:Radical SAM core domain-containing protein n=1 Tax=Trichlorobacter ammonificans TaxID=2916410 RepID=A0ABN8HBD4_9BACT|nr:radical SAM protein [Trichlorobacter ammonificans]CAH2029934.1 protein of unknown function [Trichlorobacter ammonificans]